MSLEASEVAVRVRLLGGSAFEKEAQGVSGSIKEMGVAGKSANAESAALGATSVVASRNVESFGKKISGVGTTLMGVGRSLMPASAAIAGLGYFAVKAQSQFQSSMMLLATQAGLPRRHIQALTKDILGLSKAVGQTPLALAEGAFPIVSSGTHDPKKVASLLKLAGIMAAVGHDTVGNTANALTSILNTGFHPKGGAPQIASWLEATVGAGKMHLPDLTAALGTSILPMVKMTGMSLPQILAASAALTRQGVDASSVFSRMRLSLTSVESPTSMGLKAMATLGMRSPHELADDLRGPGGLLSMLQDLHNHAMRFGPDERNNLIAQIFGKSRGIGNIGALLQSLPQMAHIFQSVIGASPDLLQRHFGMSKQTTAFKLQQLKAELDSELIKLGQVVEKDLLPALVQLVPILTSIIKWFGGLPGPVKKAIVLFGALLVVLSPLALALGGVLKVGGMLVTFLGESGPLRSVLGALGGSFGGLGSEVDAVAGRGFLGGFGGAIFRATGLFGILAGSLYLLQSKIKPLHDALEWVGHGIRSIFGGLFGGSSSPAQRGFVNGRHGLISRAQREHAAGRHGFLDAPGGTLFNPKSPGPGFHLIHRGGHAIWFKPSMASGSDLLTLPRGAMATPLPSSGLSTLRAQFGDNAGGIHLTHNTLLDGKVIATSVANINRKQLNRK